MPAKSAVSEKTGLRALLVADDPDNRAMLRSIFGRTYDVLVSSDAEEALQCSLKEQPDIIVCDLKSGFDKSLELCTNIRHNFETCHIPLFFSRHTPPSKSASRVQGWESMPSS